MTRRALPKASIDSPLTQSYAPTARDCPNLRATPQNRVRTDTWSRNEFAQLLAMASNCWRMIFLQMCQQGRLLQQMGRKICGLFTADVKGTLRVQGVLVTIQALPLRHLCRIIKKLKMPTISNSEIHPFAVSIAHHSSVEEEHFLG